MLSVVISQQFHTSLSLDTATNVLFTGDTVVTCVIICNGMKLPSTDLEKRNGIIFNHFLTPWFYLCSDSFS